MIAFLIKSTLCLTVLLGIYKLFLENEKMSVFNRFYLLGSLLFSFAVPFVSFQIPVETITVVPTNTIKTITGSPIFIEEKTNYFPYVIWSLYILVAFVFALRFVKNIHQFSQEIKSNEKIKFENATIVLVNKNTLPHTFLNYIFINKTDFQNLKIEEELFTHELTHVRQKHTLDILFIELLKTIFWFNPILIFYKKAIQLNHEFLADEKVVTSYKNVPFYQSLLLEKASWNSNIYLASNLNFLVTKKRLIMMTKTTSGKIAYLKKASVIPIFLALFYFSSAETTAQEIIEVPSKISKSLSSSDVTMDSYLAGVRIIVYKKTATKAAKDNIILNKVYEDLSSGEKENYLKTVWLARPKGIPKKSPTTGEFSDLRNSKKHAIWIDEKNVANSELSKYQPEDFVCFFSNIVYKNARTNKHPQPFQSSLYTKEFYEKSKMGEPTTKWVGDKVEIFIEGER